MFVRESTIRSLRSKIDYQGEIIAKLTQDLRRLQNVVAHLAVGDRKCIPLRRNDVVYVEPDSYEAALDGLREK